MGKKDEEQEKGLKGNPKKTQILRTLRKGKMDPTRKYVQGPLDEAPRIRGNKAGRQHVYLPHGHISRTH